MEDISIIGTIIIIVTALYSYMGFKDQLFFDGHKFEVDPILINKDYKRLVTSGFLHVSWAHLIFNMLSLYFFSDVVEWQLGWLNFTLLYFISLIGGSLFALFVHRNHGDYSAVGASGAVSGVIFASIALFPGIEIGFILIPFYIPGWLYGILYVLFSIYGIKSGKDNIGHEAHLGGALIGMATAVIMQPSALADNYRTILLIAAPTIVFIYLIITRPQILLVDNYYFRKHKNEYTIEHKYNEKKANQLKEIDDILDKIRIKGIESLNKKEKQILDEYSKTKR
jgi:membrane associated rhomboid family serine protease